jgi:hypothetical protein
MKPPYEITPLILKRISAISEKIGEIKERQKGAFLKAIQGKF